MIDTNAAGAADDARPAPAATVPPGPPPRSGLVLALLALTQLLIAADFDIVFVALPEIGRGLGFSAQSLQWVVSSYAVVLGGFLLLGGRAADRIGARRVFMLGLALFGLSSLAAGLSGGAAALIAARAVQGLGGAMLIPAALKLINTIFPEGPQRTRALAAWGMAGSTGAAIGAVGGGVLTGSLGWESIFFVNVPLTVLALLATPYLLPAGAPAADGRGFDLPGALIATAGSSLLVFGLVSGPEAGWSAARTLLPLFGGIALLGIFLLVEKRTRDPLMPLRILAHRGLSTAMALIFVFVGVIGAQYYLTTTYLQDVLGFGPLQAGLGFFPLSALSVIGSGVLFPRLLARWGLRATLFTALLGAGATMALLAAGMAFGDSYWALLPGFLWALFGGIGLPALFLAAASEVAPAEQGVAGALVTTAQNIGAAVGLAALLAVAGIAADLTAGTESLVRGLTAAGFTGAAVMAAGSLLALLLKRTAARG
ncbi:putative MFS family arabinose efflux permease [Murinocardiopsis flavida]|uniref:Putative MFS family arabinose efflux permease n=1 Tax=Murinocardiopsis flavida TaxID=645275 RepID=A0A2P8DKM5_9ACTN|nr:MFS transporter [Murinocardiopsis flavida]PSK97780.1 putative MFS family arabinose efflux permease [Murinocardiopsis flavida]